MTGHKTVTDKDGGEAITSLDISNLELELIENVERLCKDPEVVKRMTRIIANRLRPVRNVLAATERWKNDRYY